MKSKITFVLFFFVIQLHAQSDSSEKEAYLSELKVLGRKFTSNFYPNYAEIYRLPEKDFVARIDSARMGFDAALDKYTTKLEPEYVTEQRIEIKYYFDKILIDYPLTHEIYKNNYPPTLSNIPERLKSNLADFNKPEMLSNTDFTAYFKAFISLQTNMERRKGIYKNQDNQYFQATWNLIPKYITNQKCREYWQFDYLFNHIDNNGIKNLDAAYQTFKATCSDTTYVNKITRIYTDAVTSKQGHIIKTYKKAGVFNLDLHMFLPDKLVFTGKRPTIVLFHGGSWSEGKPDWFFSTCQAYAEKGWVACAVEYRTYGRHGTLPFEAVKDAMSAIRWLRLNADTYGIDSAKILATGNSAGGHLALATALVKNLNKKTDNVSVSAIPNALIVNAGVYDLTDDLTAWIRKDLKNKDQTKEISPNYLITKDFPPALIFHGTNDRNVPFAGAQKFVDNMTKAGNTSIEFYPLQGGGHFIWFDPKFADTMSKARSEFLMKIGW